MPSRESMNSVGEPFLALRREPRVTTPDREIIDAQSAGIAARDIRIMELEKIAIEWQSVAEDKQKLIEALKEELRREQSAHATLREMVRIDRDMRRRHRQVTKAERDACAAVEKLRPAAVAPRLLTREELQRPEYGHARNCACVHCAPQEMTATEVRRRLEAVACPPVRADPWDTFGVEALEKMLAARGRRVRVTGAVLINPDGSTERVQPVDLVVTVDPAKPGDDMTVISHWVDGKPLRPHTFNSFTHICEACGLTEEEAMHPGTIRGCAG